jgi:hypothetical protein
MKFVVKLKETATETVSLLREVYGEDTLAQEVFKWKRMWKNRMNSLAIE